MESGAWEVPPIPTSCQRGPHWVEQAGMGLSATDKRKGANRIWKSQPQDHLLRLKGKELQKIKTEREGSPFICCIPRWGWGKEVGEQDSYDYLQSIWASLGAQMVKNCLQYGRHGFDPWAKKIPWIMARHGMAWHGSPLQYSCPENHHGQRSPAGYSPWGHKESARLSDQVQFRVSRLLFKGFPWWLKWKRICVQCRRPGFNHWVGKMSWRREWQPTPVFLPGEPCRPGYSPWGRKKQIPFSFSGFSFSRGVEYSPIRY